MPGPFPSAHSGNCRHYSLVKDLGVVACVFALRLLVLMNHDDSSQRAPVEINAGNAAAKDDGGDGKIEIDRNATTIRTTVRTSGPRQRMLKLAFVDQYGKATGGVVDEETILHEYEVHGGSLRAALETFRKRKEASGDWHSANMIPKRRPNEAINPNAPLKATFVGKTDADFLTAAREAREANAVVTGPTSSPAGGQRVLRPPCFLSVATITTKTNQFGSYIREYFIPLFKDPADCHKALVLWFTVGDRIPIDSKLSRRWQEELKDPDFLTDTYQANNPLEYAECFFDTRAVLKDVSPPRLTLGPVQKCMIKYARAMNLLSDDYLLVPVACSSPLHTLNALYSWVQACSPQTFIEDLLRYEEAQEKMVGRHTCFNGIPCETNRGLPCCNVHHIRLGTKRENYVDNGIEAMLLEAENPFDLEFLLRMGAKAANVPHIGLLPVVETYSFTRQENNLMRCINEEVYALPGLLQYFSQFTETSRPDLADHPTNGRWTVQAEQRLVRLFALNFEGHGVVRPQWDIIQAFTEEYPNMLGLPFHRGKYSKRLAYLAQPASVLTFLTRVRDGEIIYPKDVLFDRASEKFEEEIIPILQKRNAASAKSNLGTAVVKAGSYASSKNPPKEPATAEAKRGRTSTIFNPQASTKKKKSEVATASKQVAKASAPSTQPDHPSNPSTKHKSRRSRAVGTPENGQPMSMLRAILQKRPKTY